MTRIRFLLFALMLWLLGCQTSGVVLHETPLGISDTRTAIVRVIGQPRATSENGRELLSTFYDRKGLALPTTGPQPRERRFTHVTVLGDRRPYDIEVEVVVQVRDEAGVYQEVDKDEPAARQLAEQIHKALVQSRDNRNIIDDFKPY